MMYKRTIRRDYRTWLLLLLALVPTASVLIGASWLWSERGGEISEAQDSTVPVDTSYELFLAGSQLLRAEAGLRAAALDDAGPSVLDRAETDLVRAVDGLQRAQRSMPPLVERLDPALEGEGLQEVLALMGGSLGAAIDTFEGHSVGEPLTLNMSLLAVTARENTTGQVLTYVAENDLRSSIFFDVMKSTIQYQDQFDRDRLLVLRAIETDSFDQTARQVQSSPLRDALWKDLVDARAFTPTTANVAWNATMSDPATPLLIDRTEPLTAMLDRVEGPLTSQTRDALVIELLDFDVALGNDVTLSHDEITNSTAARLATLTRERRLGAAGGVLMAAFGLALAWLTITEVRQRRKIETAHRDAVNLLAEKAERDPTTGAWNRRRLERVLPVLLAEVAAQDDSVLLAYLDLDSFKAVNDVWGHSVGDEVLRTVTDRLFDFSFDGVKFVLCRFGGDEFVIFARIGNRSAEWLEQFGDAVIQRVGAGMRHKGRLHKVGISAGIATSTSASTMDSLLLEADSSLILAKRERPSAVVYNRDESRTGELVQALPAALAGNEVLAHIQPVIDVRDGAILHVEALARWERSSGEKVPPSVFVPLAESYGLAEELTTTVLRSVHDLIAIDSTPDNVCVWVNVSPRELDVAHFAERFIALLAQVGVPPERVGLEITETAAVRDPDRLGAELSHLRDHGIGVAIDDFGNGYSPLGYLRTLPVDTVKLDRSLIDRIDTDVANQHIVIGIVGLVHELGMEITAEGVERDEEKNWLLDHGVHRMQGYLFGRPGNPDGFDWKSKAGLIDSAVSAI